MMCVFSKRRRRVVFLVFTALIMGLGQRSGTKMGAEGVSAANTVTLGVGLAKLEAENREKELIAASQAARILEDVDFAVSMSYRRSHRFGLQATRKTLFRVLLTSSRFRFGGSDGGKRLGKPNIKRISDVVCALTLFGEARGDYQSAEERGLVENGESGVRLQQDRAVVHHALIYQTMKNRVRFGKSYLLMSDSDGVFRGGILAGTPAQAAVAKNQYSCWNGNDPNLARILSPFKSKDERKALEGAALTIAGMEIGLITLSDDEAGLVTSYYSPASQRRIPGWARRRDGSPRSPLRDVYVQIGAEREYINRFYFLPFHIEEDTLPTKSDSAL